MSDDWTDKGGNADWVIQKRLRASPADMARSIDRNKARFAANILINPTNWTIARYISQRERSHKTNEGREGLRGIFDFRVAGKETFIWWMSYYASHHQGKLMLAIPPARRENNGIIEVEVNVDDDGTLYMMWENDHPQEQRLKDSKMMTNLIDGMLATRGKIIVMDDSRPRFQKSGENFKAEKIAQDDRQREAWQAMERQTNSWSSMRRTHLENGSPVPPMSTIRPYRAFVRSMLKSYHAKPVPQMTINPDATVTLEWRKTASIARIHFGAGDALVQMNDNGKITEDTYTWSRPRDVWALDFIMKLADFDGNPSHEQTKEAP